MNKLLIFGVLLFAVLGKKEMTDVKACVRSNLVVPND